MIVLKSRDEIEKLSRSNRLVAMILRDLGKMVRPGVTTLELDEAAERMIRDAGARPAFKGYKGYRYTICASVNEQVVHGVPSRRKLVEGDIVGIDVGLVLDGYYGDVAYTFPVSDVGEDVRRLLEVTRGVLEEAIRRMVVGVRLSDISHFIQSYVESRGYSVVRKFAGHGIGRSLHEDPPVPNYGRPGRGPVLREGMVLAVEPMVNMGSHEVVLLDDGWTAVTADGSLSAHFEHVVAITEEGPLVLTEV
jgi:methionyl aminopeptidase